MASTSISRVLLSTLFTDANLPIVLYQPHFGAPNSPKYQPSFMSLEPIRTPHGQLEGNDVADTSYGNETWTTEFVGLVAERGEGHGRCMRFEMVLHTYRH